MDDSASLSGIQTSVEIDVLGNDTGNMKTILSVSPRTSTTNGGSVILTNGTTNGTLTYKIVANQIKTLGHFITANNEATAAIASWHATEIGYIATYYLAVNNTIDRLGAFLKSYTGGISTLGSLVGSAGSFLGGYYGGGGKAVSFLASAYASHLNSSNADIINAAKQIATTAMRAEIVMAAGWAGVLTDSLNTQISYVPSPKLYGNDSFTYTMSEMQITSMAGMIMLVPVQSTATVSISANIADYSAMVDNINSWITSMGSRLEAHQYAFSIDLDRMYGDALMSYASSQGWTITYYHSYSTWFSGATDWWGVDASDIADELNKIGYKPSPGN